MLFDYSNVMENYLRLLMETVEDLSQDTNKYQNYQKLYSKQQQSKEAQLTKRVSISITPLCATCFLILPSFEKFHFVQCAILAGVC